MIGNVSITDNQKEEIDNFVNLHAFYPRTYRQVRFIDKCHQLQAFIEVHKALPEKKDDAQLWKWFTELPKSCVQDDVVMRTAISELRESISSIFISERNDITKNNNNI